MCFIVAERVKDKTIQIVQIGDKSNGRRKISGRRRKVQRKEK